MESLIDRCSGRARRLLAGLTALALLAWASDLGAGPRSVLAAQPMPADGCFTETGFCIREPAFRAYFGQRGAANILGFPISRDFMLDGFRVQFFQRVVLQLQGGGVARLNLLDSGLMPVLQANGSTFPAPDPALAQGAPKPEEANYPNRVVEFVQRVAPDTWQGQPVGFFNLFNTTVPVSVAFPNGPPNPSLVTLLNLEIWGLPTSNPAPDPRNGQFVYQRFQRGIMHFRASCPPSGSPCTQGILIGDYFKSVITGKDLPPDLATAMQTSRYYGQYTPGNPRWLTRPGELPNSDLTGAFEPGLDPPQAKPRIRLQDSELVPLAAVLARDGLTPTDVDTGRTVSYVMPTPNGVVLSVAPLTRPPTTDSNDLLQKGGGVPIGVLLAGRPLPLAVGGGDVGQPTLARDVYLVRVRQGRMEFVASNAGNTVTGPPADMRALTRWVGPPQTITTAKDMCFSWNLVQVCSPPSPLAGLTAAERRTSIQDPLNRTIQALGAQLGNASINVDAAISEAEGDQAVKDRRASLLAAPIQGASAPARLVPTDGALLGVLQVMLPIDIPGSPSVPAGDYAVRVAAAGQGQWRARLILADGRQLDVPAEALQVRGGADQPLAIVANLCFFSNSLCMFAEP